MADQNEDTDRKDTDKGRENNNKTEVSVKESKVVIVGNNTVLNFTETQGQASGLNSPEPVALPQCSDKDELDVVKKVSEFIQKEYLIKYAKVNRNELKPQQTFLQGVFVKPDLEPVDVSCDSVQNDCDPIYKIFPETNIASLTRVLIYGQAFIGKSILCQKYVYDWANPAFQCPKPFNGFKIVIKLSEVNGTLEEILEREIFCSRLTEDEKVKFFNYMKKNPHEMLFLLDGVSADCGIDKLIDMLDQKYKGAYLIAAIRPEPNDIFLKISKAFHARYRIAGYSVSENGNSVSENGNSVSENGNSVSENGNSVSEKDSVLEYISKYFGQNKTKDEAALKECLETNADLMQLARIPLVTLALCEFWNEQADKSLTITKVLRRYTELVFKLYKLNSGEEIKLEDVLSNYEQLAVLDITKDKTQFTQDELTTCKVDAKVGFLCSELNDKGSYKFTHEKVQQYLAAKWIVENWNLKKAEELLSFMLSHFESSTCSSVLIFVAGLLAEKKDALLQWLERLTNSGTIFVDSCYCSKMDLFLASAAEAWTEDNSQAISSLCVGLQPFKKTENCYPPVLSHGAAQGLGLVVRKLGISRLNLGGTMIGHSEAKIIASKCLQQNSKLTSVKFSHSCLRSDAVKAVCDACARMLHLKELDLSCCIFGDGGLQAIAHLVREGNAPISSLQLSANQCERVSKVDEPKHQMSRQKSLDTIKNITKFQEEYKSSPPSEESIKALIAAVDNENYLTDISLPSCCVGNLVNQWLEVFERNKNLERIKIYLKELTKSLEENLVKVANNMAELKTMSVVIEDEGSHRTDYVNHRVLEERTEGKLKITIEDHTQSVTHPAQIISKLGEQ